MADFFRPLLNLRGFSVESLVHVVDIFLVSYLIYRLLSLIRGTRAWRIVAGIGLFIALLVLSNYLHLTTLHWVLDKATLLAPVALVILLLPELRQALEGIGKLGGWTEKLVAADHGIEAQTVEEIVAAVAEMSAARVGSLMVLERISGLEEVIATGVVLEARVSAALLSSIFYEGNPLHDGAVVIRGDRIAAAACRLPLSENRMDASLHMRHRAAVGISEQHDCLVVVTSEERGTISVCRDGKLQKFANPNELRDALKKELRRTSTDSADDAPKKGRFKRIKVAK